MPLLDIATAQPSFRTTPRTIRCQIFYHGTFLSGCDKRLASTCKTYRLSEKVKNLNMGCLPSGVVIRAVATLELKLRRNDGQKDYPNLQLDTDPGSSTEVEHQSENEQVDERERLRRTRISKANKGNTPWNKGKKHSPETLRKIAEKTRLAMQNPKVKMKLANLGHAQSEETRIKIGMGVRVGWERRREKQMLQETCHFEWQNLIAEASRSGSIDQKELQWDSYKLMDEQLTREWLEAVELKNRPYEKIGKRAPKSLEQRRKISAAISAKWADPMYRDKVYSGLSKYHGSHSGFSRLRRRRPDSNTQQRGTRSTKNKSDLTDDSEYDRDFKPQQPKVKRSKMPLYEDPLASSKLEMIKNMKARRLAAANEKIEAIKRAKVLIAEAEKAAKVLEVAAKTSPLAQASLIETRKLIAEAIQSLQSADTQQVDDTHKNAPPLAVNHVGKEKEENIENHSQGDQIKVNGFRASRDLDVMDLGSAKFNMQDLLNVDDEIDDILPDSSSDDGLENGWEELNRTVSSNYDLPHLDLDLDHVTELPVSSNYDLPHLDLDHVTELPGATQQQGSKVAPNRHINGVGSLRRKERAPRKRSTTTKKWVCGKLVEVVEDN